MCFTLTCQSVTTSLVSSLSVCNRLCCSSTTMDSLGAHISAHHVSTCDINISREIVSCTDNFSTSLLSVLFSIKSSPEQVSKHESHVQCQPQNTDNNYSCHDIVITYSN